MLVSPTMAQRSTMVGSWLGVRGELGCADRAKHSLLRITNFAPAVVEIRRWQPAASKNAVQVVAAANPAPATSRIKGIKIPQNGEAWQ